MFFLSKFLPLILLPFSFFNFLLIISIFRNKKFLSIGLLSSLFLISTNIFAYGIMGLLESPWRRYSPRSLPFSDAIVVLSGNNIFFRGDEKFIEWSDPDRFLAGIDLYKKGVAKKLIFTGEVIDENHLSGDLYRLTAIKAGVPNGDIEVTSITKNTFEESIKVKEMLNLRDKKLRIVLITSAYHMTRAESLFKSSNLEIIPYPVDFYIDKTKRYSHKSFLKNPYNWFPNAKSLSLSSTAIRELFGIFFYKLIDLKVKLLS